MKTPVLPLALVAVLSSASTVLLLELLRPRHDHGPSVRASSASAPARPDASASPASEPLVGGSSLTGGATGLADRLDELERRLRSLESGTRREPVLGPAAGDALPAEAATREGLRGLVLDWVGEENEARRLEREREHASEREAERRFDARFEAYMLATEHDLEPWQQRAFEDLFLEIRQREEALEESFDLTRDDPAEVEEQWEEFDQWVDERERYVVENFAPELAEDWFGEEDDEDELLEEFYDDEADDEEDEDA